MRFASYPIRNLLIGAALGGLVWGPLVRQAAADNRSGQAKSAVLLVGRLSPPIDRAVVDELRRRRLSPQRAPLPLPPSAPKQTAESGPSVVEQARAALQRAKDLYAEAETHKAAQLLSAQIASAAERLVMADHFDLLHSLQLWLGICLAKSGEGDAAAAAFTAALMLRGQPLDSTRFAPAVLTSYSKALQALSKARTVALSVRLEPRVAALQLDGRVIQAERVEVKPGTHWVRAEALGYQPTAQMVEVAEGPTMVNLTLRPTAHSTLVAQVAALQQRGTLDLTDQSVAAALGRIAGTEEALIVAESAAGPGRVRLRFTRIRCRDGHRLALIGQTAPRVDVRATVQHALGRLWPGSPDVRSAIAAKPVYKRWWFWTLVGLAVSAGTAAAVVGATRSTEPTYNVVMR